MHKNRLNYFFCISVIATLALTGCGQDSSAVRDDRTGISAAQPAAQEAAEAVNTSSTENTAEATNTDNVTTETTDAATIDSQAAATEETETEFIEADEAYIPTEIVSDYSAEYKAAIIRINEKHETPDLQHKMNPVNGSYENSSYAVKDVDNDGREELLLRFMDGGKDNFEAIYEYDPASDYFRCELFQSESTDLEIYKNGSVKACWTNTSGLNPEFVPFNIYVYNEETDKYDYRGYIESWDVTYSETDNEGNAFSTKHDLDENGIIYAMQFDKDYEYSFIYDDADFKELSDKLFSSKTHKLSWINF